MKKKVLSALLVAAMSTTMLAGCGSTSDDGKTSENKSTSDSQTSESGTQAAQSDIPEDLGSGTVKVWVADEVVDFTKEKAEAFMKDNGYNYEVQVEAVGEGEAAGNMITDVEGGADVYSFAQDQMARLVSANALQKLSDSYAQWVADENDSASSSAVKVGDATYAFPITSDNTYFMFYDKSVISDPTSLEQVIADCESNNKNFYMEINGGWYQTAFFFGTGCKLEYATDEKGNFTSSVVTYASDEGVVALREIVELANSKSFQNGSAVDDAQDIGAIVSGTWNVAAAKKKLKDNYACAKLPSFEGSDGKTYQMSGFSGFKFIGVKPQTEVGKAYVCLELAKYLSSADVQVDRYNTVGWGPSNKTAQQDSTIQADEALVAVTDQMQYDIPQGQYPGDYWTLATALGDDIIGGKISKDASDDDLMKKLEEFQTTCQGYAQ